MTRIAFILALIFIFLRFSYLHEMLVNEAGVNLYLLLLAGVPAVLAALFGGAVQRTMATPMARWFMLFYLWALIATPFSTWRSDSIQLMYEYSRTTLPVMFLIAGTVLSARHLYTMLGAISLGALVNVLYAELFQRAAGRLTMEFGSIGNPNDFAAHCLMVLPIVLWVALTAKLKAVRFGAGALFLAVLLEAAGTGSRGALLAAAAVAGFVILRAHGIGKLALAFVLPLLAIALFFLIPQSLKTRYADLFGDKNTPAVASSGETSEADASRLARMYLLTTSLDLSLRNPLFGVGPGEFANTEGGESVAEGRHGAWQVSHNTYTQLSSECGFPALIFVVAALISCYRALNSVYKRAIGPARRDLRLAAFCLMMSLVGFCAAIFFLSLAFSMYLPALVGLAAALDRTARQELPDPAVPVYAR